MTNDIFGGKKKTQIYGTVQASADRSAYSNDMTRWLVFENVQNLAVQGGGTINGNGKTWWENSCKVNDDLVIMPLITLSLSLSLFLLIIF